MATGTSRAAVAVQDLDFGQDSKAGTSPTRDAIRLWNKVIAEDKRASRLGLPWAAAPRPAIGDSKLDLLLRSPLLL